LVGFVAAHGDAFELIELAEEVLDQVTPLVDFCVDDEWLCAPGMLGDYDLGSPLVRFGDDCVRIKGLVSQQTAELDTFEKWRDSCPRGFGRGLFFIWSLRPSLTDTSSYCI
jgi:hypothetical protein